MLKKYICAGFSFGASCIAKKEIADKYTLEYEILVLVLEKYNIILKMIRKSIYWVMCSVSAFFIIKGKIFRKVFWFFYNFLPKLVVGKRKGKRSFASLKGMEGGELLWSNLLPVGMKQICIGLIVTAKRF